MKVYIFTEGGTRFGYGHIVRCSSLYSELKRRDVDVRFVVNGDSIIDNKKYLVKNWLSVDFLSKLLNHQTYTIIDSYLADINIYKFISHNCKKALFIDDNFRLQYPRGIVVNPALYVERSKYPKNENIEYLLGSQFIILRDSFLHSTRKTIKKEVKEILVTLGGSDTRNLTPKILDLLKVKFPNVIKNVIVGNGFDNAEEIRGIGNKNINYYYNINGMEMNELMLRSDLAISAAGQTIHELIKTSTPFIPIQVVLNQNNNVRGLLKYDLVNQVLNYKEKDFMKKLFEEIRYVMDFDTRSILYIRSKEVIDGFGSKRIIDRLLA